MLPLSKVTEVAGEYFMEDESCKSIIDYQLVELLELTDGTLSSSLWASKRSHQAGSMSSWGGCKGKMKFEGPETMLWNATLGLHVMELQ